MKRQLSLMLKMLPFAAFLACATTSTKVATSWKAPDYGGMKNVLVAGIAKDPATRRAFEDSFVEQLKKHKVAATPSYTVFPGDKIPSKEEAGAYMKKNSIDTILITRVTDTKDVQTYVPGTTSPYSSYWGYYGYGWNYTYSPGYTVENTQVVLETNLYNVANEALEWTAVSDTTTQGDRKDVIKSFIPAIVNKMKDDKLF
jgi:hypothetical protein